MVTLRRNPADTKMTSDQGDHRQVHIINETSQQHEPPEAIDALQRTQYHLCDSC